MIDRLSIRASILWIVLCATAWSAERGPERGQFFVSPMLGYYELSDELGFEDGETGPGLGIGYVFLDHWAVEASYYHFDGEVRRAAAASVADDADVDAVWANVLWMFPTTTTWQPYGTVGAGRTHYDFGSAGDEDVTEFNLGFGAFVGFSSRVALRGDARAVYLSDENDVVPFVSLGVSVALGRVEAEVVPDVDGDRDGVPDLSDQCPNTPVGRRVDLTGCELDGDRDGVVDGRDACPNTPAGAPVDLSGCALDSDGDGVPDFRDDCPDTEAGAKVDERGCYIELEETVTIDLQVEFASDSAELRPQYRDEVARVIVFLRQYPTSIAVVEGHTDNTGAESYNKALSQRRAQSIVNELIAGAVDPGRLSAVGFGEQRPIATNETREGRQRNRRVSAVMSGTHTVRQ